MAEPSIIKVKQAAADRRRIIQSSEKQLKYTLERLQRQLNAFISKELLSSLKTDKEGNLLKGVNNSIRAKANQRLRNLLNTSIDKQIRELINKELAKIDNANKKYYKLFKPDKDLSKKANKKAARLSRSFKRHVLNTMSFNAAITQTIGEGIENKLSIKELKLNLKNQIEGKDKLGIIEHHFWKQEGFEQFQVHARAVSETYAKGLNLDYAIYAGGEIKTTREFCDERNGKVYTRSEIISWNSEEWQGKKKDNNIFIDCGGYNCRHEFDWISKQLAVRLRPDLA